MDHIDKALADLATSFALPGLALNEKGVASLRIGDLGEVQLERWRGDGLLVAMYRKLDPDLALRMLEACAPSGEHPWPLTAGMDGHGRMGFVMRLPREDAALAQIERCLTHMTGLFDRLV